MAFIQRIGNHNVFEFECPCGACGEVGVPVSRMYKVFPHDTCGTLLIQKPASGMFGTPTLEIVTEAK